MRLYDFNVMTVQELTEVLVKMAVIIITIGAEMKIFRSGGNLFNCLPDAHNLEGLFAGNAGSSFKISLQGS